MTNLPPLWQLSRKDLLAGRPGWQTCPNCAERDPQDEDAWCRFCDARVSINYSSSGGLYRWHRFADASLGNLRWDWYPSHIRRLVQGYADKLEEHVREGRGLILAGSVGCGKTHMAVGMGVLTLGLGFSVYATTFGQLLHDIRATWSDHKQADEDGMLTFIEEVDLLILDDLGMEQKTAWALDRLIHVVNLRYSGGRAVLVTSNLAPEELCDNWSLPVLSRLYHSCQAISFVGAPDFRRRLRPQEIALSHPVWPGTDAEVVVKE